MATLGGYSQSVAGGILVGGLGSTAPTSQTETTVGPATLTARTDLDEAQQALGQPLPIVVGTGRVDGVYFVGGVETISTLTTTTTKTPNQPQSNYIAVGQNPGAAQMGASHQLISVGVGTTTTTTASSTQIQTQVLAGYVLAYDVFEVGYDLIRLEIDGDLVFDGEGVSPTTATFRFYGGQHTTVDPILTEIIGANAGAYQNFVMIFIDGYPADSPPSISAVISNGTTDTGETRDILWTGSVPPVMDQYAAGYAAGYDPGTGVIYQAIDVGSAIYLAALDSNTFLERYRVPLEGLGSYAGYSRFVHVLHGTGYAMVMSGPPLMVGPPQVNGIFDVSSGQMVASYTFDTATDGPLWLYGDHYGSRYMFIGQDVYVGSTGPICLLVDVAAGTAIYDHIDSATHYEEMCLGPMSPGEFSFYSWGINQLEHSTFDGSAWTSATIYGSPGDIRGVWYDAETGYLLVSEVISAVEYMRYLDPLTGAMTRSVTLPYALLALSSTFSYGRERFWPAPGYIFAQKGGVDDPAEIDLFDIQAGTITVYASDPSLTNNGFTSGSFFDQNRRMYITGFGSAYWTVHSLPGSAPRLIDLDQVVTDCMSIAGFGPPDLTFYGFEGLQTWGFVIAADTTIQTVVRAISDIYGFAWCDTGSGFVFKKPGTGALLSIDAALATADLVERDQPVMSQDEADIRTPSMVEMQYMSKEGPYKVRPTSFSMTTGVLNSITTPKFSTPILFNDAEAQRIVQEKFFEYQEKRRGHTLIAAPENITLLPGDIVSFPSGSRTYIARVEDIAIDLRNMGVEISARDFQTDVETSVTAVSNTGLVWQVVYFASQYLHLDMPLLRYADDTAGASLVQYGALVPRGQALWSGATLWRGPVATAFAAIFDQLPHQGVMGVCETVFPAPFDPFALDDTSTLTIRRITAAPSTGSGLVDATEDEVLAGVNNALVGIDGRWEWVGYKTVVDNLDGTYTLSGFTLRGHRGSEVFCGLHELGDAFITIDQDWVRKAMHPVDDLGDSFFYKAPGLGQPFANVPATQHVVTGAAETPYACVNLDALEGSPDGIDISWDYRSRIATGLNPANFGEEDLAFEVDIYDTDGTTYLRTLATTTGSVHYATADVVSDFGSDPPPELYFRVFMMSALPILVPGQARPVEGRGYEARGYRGFTTQTINLTGQSITISVGTVTAAAVALNVAAVTGQSLSASVGAVAVSIGGGTAVSAGVTGQAVTTSVGTVTVVANSAVTAAVTGQALAASVGTAFVPFWVTSASANPTTDNTGWATITARVTIDSSVISNTGGSKVRITFKAGSAGINLTECYIGPKSGTYGFTAATQIKFGGNSGVTAGANATVLSDEMNFTIPAATSLTVAYTHNFGSTSVKIGTQAGFQGYFNVGSFDASNTAPSGYTTGTANSVYGISLIEST